MADVVTQRVEQGRIEARLRLGAAGLSLAASLTHGAVAPEHLREWWGVSAFFLLAATAQGLYAVLLVLRPWGYDETGGWRVDPERYAGPFYRAGVAGNAAIIVLYLLSRTVGIPFLGPQAGRIEAVTVLGVASKLIELALIACLLLLRRGSQAASSEGP